MWGRSEGAGKHDPPHGWGREWILGVARAKYSREILLLSLTVTVTLFLSEVAYRVYQYYTLPDRLFALVDAQVPANQGIRSAGSPIQEKIPDVYAGYVYAPNFQGHRGHPWHSRWQSNSHGHVSGVEYPLQKPSGEYRIAVVGDSFTANITNNVRWTEVLQGALNGSTDWRSRVGGKFTRVINFGVDGMGMVQFAAMVRHHALAFEPDFVIVNMISDSILRRMRYAGVPIPSSDRTEHIRLYVRKNFVEQINWLNPCPELIVAVVGRLWGKRCMLPLNSQDILAADPSFRFSNRAEALSASGAAVRDILSASREVLFLVMPLYQELDSHNEPMWRGLVDDLRAAVPETTFVSMRPQMEALLDGKRLKDRPELAGKSLHQILELPAEQHPELYRWFFLPDDVHYTDYGSTLYAHEVAKLLVSRSVLAR